VQPDRLDVVPNHHVKRRRFIMDNELFVTEEAKMLSMKVADGKFLIEVDPNKNGKPVLTLALDLSEVPSEVASIFVKK
jgi:hypothetical protein